VFPLLNIPFIFKQKKKPENINFQHPYFTLRQLTLPKNDHPPKYKVHDLKKATEDGFRLKLQKFTIFGAKSFFFCKKNNFFLKYEHFILATS